MSASTSKRSPASLKGRKQHGSSQLNSPPVPTPINSEASHASYNGVNISSPSKPHPPVQLNLPDTPTKKGHLESPVIARLRKTASTKSTDSGLDSERSSRASLSPSDGISLEFCSHASNLAETPPESKPGKAFNMSLQPPVKNLSANSLDSGCQSQTSSRSSLRMSEENTFSTLDLSKSQHVENSPSFPSCHSEKSSRTSLGTIREEVKLSSPILINYEVDDSKPHPPPPKILGCPEPPLLGRRVSVEEKVLSDLLEVAMKLKNNAQPMDHLDVKDGPYPRRSSVPNEAPQPRQRTRKTSSQPFFHCLMDIPKSPARRKTSGCIVCDRNRKISQSHSPSDSTVIIKTTMSRKSLPFRRFSEALQVVRRSQSDIPYVELYVLNVEDLKKLRDNYNNIKPQKPNLSHANKHREEAIEECVTDNLPDFIRYTNWTNILSHLISKKLLSRDDGQKLRALTTNTERGNFFYLEVLPSKGSDAYCTFYECLKAEQEHRGHEELSTKLDKALSYI